MIVNSINDALDLNENDGLLDIGCGNGALSRYFFSKCSFFQGVDFSPYLIQVAKDNFEIAPTHVFTEMDALQYVEKATDTNVYTKGLCYGAFSYLSFENAEKLLSALSRNYPNIDRFFIGNLPDKARSHLFFKEKRQADFVHDDPESPIGIWRTRDEFEKLAKDTGWNVIFSVMPDSFYAAHYRYDALLVRG